MAIQLSAFAFTVSCLFLFVILQQRKILLAIRILTALVSGILLGTLLKFVSPYHQLFIILTEFLRLLGSGYLSLLKMLVLPLVMTSILHTILNFGSQNVRQINKITFSATALLLILTGLASIIGLLSGMLFHVGQGLELPGAVSTGNHLASANLTDTMLAILPSNLFANLVKENTVAVVIFTILFGYCTLKLHDSESKKFESIKLLVAALFSVVKQLTQVIIELTPYGIFGLLALLCAKQGITVFLSMLNFILAIHVAMFTVLLIHALLLWIYGYHPIIYIRKAFVALFVAFTTRSSFGTLPVSEMVLSKNFNIHPAIPSIVPSIGATIGMNACAGVFPAIVVVMTLTALQQPITWHYLLFVPLINMLASLGVSGIPGTASIAAGVTLSSLGLPYAGLAFIQGIDPIIDMTRTAVNVNGVLTTSLVVNQHLQDELKAPDLVSEPSTK